MIHREEKAILIFRQQKIGSDRKVKVKFQVCRLRSDSKTRRSPTQNAWTPTQQSFMPHPDPEVFPPRNSHKSTKKIEFHRGDALDAS
ncbi:hypothetical protein R1flu_007894 [Riccia fluitans]|uniref:Uncharacterized protein n=1 Tax=Riccia fluitans TaxID=41844 RepID=A0ABD1Z112_9MARC